METNKEPILYVDDENENLQGFNYLLRRDFQVYLASSAKEGLEILRNNKIKVVLTDQRMPEVTGIEFLEQVINEFPNAIRIIVTAYSDSDTIIQAINQGKVYHFITKPWNNNELKNIINRAIEIYNLKYERVSLIENLQKMNQELMAAKEKAEESDKLKTSFLANMSHEVRTPLNAIIGFTNLLVNENSDQELKKQFLKIIENSSNDLINIIEDILDSSRIDSGSIKLNESEIDIHKMMCDLLISSENFNQQQEKNVTINYKYPRITDKVSIISDNVRLKQIVNNLISNAIKFTENGTVDFGYTIEEDNGKRIIKFFVTDTGIGISNDKFEYIFERFRKIEGDAEKLYRGNGLGLYIAKRLAIFMGGDIQVSSEPGKGSTFTLVLPFKTNMPSESIEIKKATNVRDLKWPGKTLLIVEDENSNYKYLEAILNKKLNLLWVKNGVDAVHICNEVHIDLVLMDIKLPKMNGFEATRLIKSKHQNLPIIAVTAYAMEADREQSIEAGCDNFISKPFRMEELFTIIDTYIG